MLNATLSFSFCVAFCSLPAFRPRMPALHPHTQIPTRVCICMLRTCRLPNFRLAYEPGSASDHRTTESHPHRIVLNSSPQSSSTHSVRARAGAGAGAGTGVRASSGDGHFGCDLFRPSSVLLLDVEESTELDLQALMEERRRQKDAMTELKTETGPEHSQQHHYQHHYQYGHHERDGEESRGGVKDMKEGEGWSGGQEGKDSDVDKEEQDQFISPLNLYGLAAPFLSPPHSTHSSRMAGVALEKGGSSKSFTRTSSVASPAFDAGSSNGYEPVRWD